MVSGRSGLGSSVSDAFVPSFWSPVPSQWTILPWRETSVTAPPFGSTQMVFC
jgi:hypothetical protein